MAKLHSTAPHSTPFPSAGVELPPAPEGLEVTPEQLLALDSDATFRVMRSRHEVGPHLVVCDRALVVGQAQLKPGLNALSDSELEALRGSEVTRDWLRRGHCIVLA